jgi:tetratricopeptide (TPR) repeat protein
MRGSQLLLGLIFATTLNGLSQSAPVRIEGIAEPPEMIGPPQTAVQPSAADRQFLDALGDTKTEAEMPARLPLLDKLIADHPDYADAYSFRAYIEACMVDPPRLTQAEFDVAKAQSLGGGKAFDDQSRLSLLGKIAFADGDDKRALDDLEKAMRLDLSSADKIFNIEGVVPERASKFCAWNLTDLDHLVTKYPKDWRPVALRGLYYQFFTTFKEDYYANATAEFQKAAVIDPKSPVPAYLLGELHTKAAFWTKKAWASDAGRDDATRAAVLPFTTAIHLDASFTAAYDARAEAYLQLKQSALAVKDFDRVIALDPTNSAAYADRGLAQTDLGRYFDAISDFGEAIRLAKEGDSYLPDLYENRGDAYVKTSNYRSAIEDYDEAIALRVQSQIFIWSLAQFRGMYPEYNGVSDDALLHKLNVQFQPQFTFDVFKKQLTEENGKWAISLVNDLYEKRGDAYLQSGDFKHAIQDFQRIFMGIPNFANSVERWRPIGNFGHGDRYFLDVKSSDVSANNSMRLWIKEVGAKQSIVIAFGMNCGGRQINQMSSITYGSNENILSSSDYPSGWADVVPDTLGEQLWSGACLSSR